MSVVAEQADAFRMIAEDLDFDIDDLDPQEVVDHIARMWADLPGILDARDDAIKRAERAEAACAAMVDEVGKARHYISLNYDGVSVETKGHHLAAVGACLDRILNSSPDLDELERLRVEAREKSDEIVRCAFCGEAYPPGTPTSQNELLSEHIAACPKHPMREIEREFNSYMYCLAESIGVDMDEYRKPSAHGNDRLRWAVLISLRIGELQKLAAREAGEGE